MQNKKDIDVIIVGGSYAGLSAAMALGRSMRNVLVIDSGKPCNQQTPYAHNFVTEDGATPQAIRNKAKAQAAKYSTIQFLDAVAASGCKTENGFAIETETGKKYNAKKLLFATGVTDLMPPIKGFAECWGISVLHCPYCHGYEVKQQNTGLIGNGDFGFELSRLIYNWTKKLTLCTNGISTLTTEQTQKIKSRYIDIVETEIAALEHTAGNIQQIVFTDGSIKKVTAIFARPGFKQHCLIPEQLGCAITEQGYLKTDDFHKTNVHGLFAAGDATNGFRAVSTAIAAGTKAGAVINKELIDESF